MTQAKVNNSFSIVRPVNDNDIVEARSWIGKPIRFVGWNLEATVDTIRHYAWGLGDDNPLWCNPEYGEKTQYGTIIAPPTFLYSICDAVVAPGLVGLQPVYAGSEWDFYLPVKRNDTITYKAKCIDAQEFKGKSGGRMIMQTGLIEYFNQNNEKVAQVRSNTWRLGRKGTSEGLAYKPRQRYQYSEAEMKEIENGVRSEIRRGEDVRYWENVNVGDSITPVVKGPLDRITMTCYYAGVPGTSGYRASELRWKNWIRARENPELLPNNYDVSYYSEFTLPSEGHQDDTVAHDVGMPGAYDNGPQRIGWSTHLITNWMGDDGWLEHINIQVRRPNLFGDTTWIKGTVTKTESIDDEYGRVYISIEGHNQLGELNTKGEARVKIQKKN